MELTGITGARYLDVIKVTKQSRAINPQVPKDLYVVEYPAIDGIVIWQNASGSIYKTTPHNAPVKIADSLAEYLVRYHDVNWSNKMVHEMTERLCDLKLSKHLLYTESVMYKYDVLMEKKEDKLGNAENAKMAITNFFEALKAYIKQMEKRSPNINISSEFIKERINSAYEYLMMNKFFSGARGRRVDFAGFIRSTDYLENMIAKYVDSVKSGKPLSDSDKSSLSKAKKEMIQKGSKKPLTLSHFNYLKTFKDIPSIYAKSDINTIDSIKDKMIKIVFDINSNPRLDDSLKRNLTSNIVFLSNILSDIAGKCFSVAYKSMSSLDWIERGTEFVKRDYRGYY